MELALITVQGSPAFTIGNVSPSLSRVHGGVFEKVRNRWLFPAYPPFGRLVLEDIKKVLPGVMFTPEVTAHYDHLLEVPAKIKQRVLPSEFTFATKPFDHQHDGLCNLYYHPRFACYWDAGTGKTKVLVDLKRLLPSERMLVITPKVTVMNWVREFERHSAGQLKATAILGTPEKKRKLITEAHNFDAVVVSYRTASRMGVPQLHAPALTRLKAVVKERGITTRLPFDLAKGIRVLADPDEQLQFLERWVAGETAAAVIRAAAAQARLTPQWLCDLDYGIIAADESHNLQSISSAQTKTALALSKKAPRRYLLSGTPSLGDPRHLYAQMRFLSPAIIHEDWPKFLNTFLVRSAWNPLIITGFQNLDILNTRVQRVSIRKTKAECLDLPERTIIDVPVTLSAPQKKAYNALVNDLSLELNEYFGAEGRVEVANAATLLNKLAQVSAGFLLEPATATGVCDKCPHVTDCVSANIQPYTPACKVHPGARPTTTKLFKENPKLDALDELLDAIFQNPKAKVIIWGVYRAELKIIADYLTAKSVSFVKVDGSIGKSPQPLIDKFEEDPTCRVYLGQIATGIGITLNAATYTIYYSLDWSLGTYLQSIDRNYRAGQTSKVTVYRLIGQGTVDGYKAVALDQKKDLSATITNKLACVTCEHAIKCLTVGIELFDTGCIYKRSMPKVIAKAKELCD